MGLSKELSCEAGSFSYCCLNLHRCFQSEVWGFISPHWSPGLHSVLCSPTIPPSSSMCECGTSRSASCSLVCPFIPQSTSPPGCPTPPLLPVWMNVSSLSPLLLDFRVVWFSVSSGWFFILNCSFPSFCCVRKRSVSTYAYILVFSRIIFLEWKVIKAKTTTRYHLTPIRWLLLKTLKIQK